MSAYIYLSSIRDFARVKRLWPWLVLAFGTAALAIVWRRFQPDTSGQSLYVGVSGILLFRLLALASAIFTTAIVSQEVENKTIIYLLTRPVPRWRLLLFRYLASVTIVALLGMFTALCLSGGVYGSGFASNTLLAKDCEAIVFGAFAYGALFVLVSLVFNRSMIICLLFAFGWETSIPNMPGEMYRLSIYSYLQGIAEHPSTATATATAETTTNSVTAVNTISKAMAIGTLVPMAIVLVALACWWFTHFEFVPREEAE